MRITKSTVDKGLTIVAAVVAAVDPVAVQNGWISTGVATAIGAGVTAVVASYHGGATVSAKLSGGSDGDLSAGTDGPGNVAVIDGDPSLASI